MSHDATTLRRGRRVSRRLLGAALGALVLTGVPAATAAAQLPGTDVRSTLAAGAGDTAGKAQLGLQHLANLPKPEGLTNTNADIAFSGNYAYVGNYNGVAIYDISNKDLPVLKVAYSCPGGQNDVSVYRNLLFVSVESTTAGRVDCSSSPRDDTNPDKKLFRGVRVFDITDPLNPVRKAAVQTCRGSHTHTLVEGKDDPNSVYIYNSGTAGVRAATELAGCDANNTNTPTGTDPSKWKIDVIKVPLNAPETAAIVGGPRLFAGADGRVDGLQNAVPTPQHPCASAVPQCGPGTNASTGGQTWSPSPISDACHDITVYEEINLAAGACEGNGLLIDISDPANPKRIDAVADPLFAYWHGATFSNDGKAVLFTDEWGGGSAARCRATDQLSWGADAIYEIVDKKLVFRSYYKLPIAQTNLENCVSHVGNLLPLAGRNVLIQAWYQGGVSVVDWTNLSQPKEIAYFDRGPINPTAFSSGGFWSTYWYKGRIYGSEISRGFDSFKLTPTADLSAQDIAIAESAKTKNDRHNAQTQESFLWEAPPANGGVGGSVPATLSLSLGTPGSFGAFTPGLTKLYETSTPATVTHTAGDALLSVSDTGPTPGFLVNGAFSLPQPLQIRARNAGNTGTAYNNVGSSYNLLQYSGPVSSDAVSLQFAQQINQNDALRTGTYSKTLTFTLSTTNP